ncbi:hypothetical protein ACOSQ3_031387 [Xanthoceras sorbifolium]
MHGVVVSSVVFNDMNERRKYIIRCDKDVYFLLVCDRPVHEIYVDVVEKVDNHVRYSPQIPAPISGWSTEIPDALRLPSLRTNFVGASISNITPSTDIPLWEGDHGIPPSLQMITNTQMMFLIQIRPMMMGFRCLQPRVILQSTC